MSSIIARVVAMIGAVLVFMRRAGERANAPAFGKAPAIPDAKAQGLPTLKMPTARGWDRGNTPKAAPGLAVNAFAENLDHPRWIYVLPTGDVLVAEAIQEGRPPEKVFDYAMQSTMRRARALGKSANRISLFRDADGDGVADVREVFLDGLNQPFGMAVTDDRFYVGNTDGIVAFPYVEGATRIEGPGKKLVDFKPHGHWTRSLLVSPDGAKLYAGVGSLTNIADEGMEVEEGRAAIHVLDRRPRTAASLHPACAIRSAWRSSRQRQHFGLWSMNATASATKCRPTI